MRYKTKAKSFVIRIFVYLLVAAVFGAVIIEQPWEQGYLSISTTFIMVLAFLFIVFPFPFDVTYEMTDDLLRCERRIFLYSKTLEVPLSAVKKIMFNDAKKDYSYYLNERGDGVFHDYVPDGTLRYARSHWVVEYLIDGKKHYLAILPDEKMLQLLKQRIIN